MHGCRHALLTSCPRTFPRSARFGARAPNDSALPLRWAPIKAHDCREPAAVSAPTGLGQAYSKSVTATSARCHLRVTVIGAGPDVRGRSGMMSRTQVILELTDSVPKPF